MSWLKHAQVFHLSGEVSTTWDIGHSLLEIFYGLMTSLAFNLAMQKVIRDIETWKF